MTQRAADDYDVIRERIAEIRRAETRSVDLIRRFQDVGGPGGQKWRYYALTKRGHEVLGDRAQDWWSEDYDARYLEKDPGVGIVTGDALDPDEEWEKWVPEGRDLTR